MGSFFKNYEEFLDGDIKPHHLKPSTESFWRTAQEAGPAPSIRKIKQDLEYRASSRIFVKGKCNESVEKEVI